MGTTPLPVTVAATRRARPAAAADLQRWATSLCAAAAEFPGHVGSEIRSHRGRRDADVTVSLTFASAAAASTWEGSPERADLVVEGDRLTDGPATAPQLLFGGTPPPRWRTALIVATGLFPFAVLLNVAAGTLLGSLPVLPRTVLTTLALVLPTVYLGIPLVQKVIAWRHRPADPPGPG